MPFDAPVISMTCSWKFIWIRSTLFPLSFARVVSFPQPALTEGFLGAMLEVKHFAP
jgi:hypothetical protein